MSGRSGVLGWLEGLYRGPVSKLEIVNDTVDAIFQKIIAEVD